MIQGVLVALGLATPLVPSTQLASCRDGALVMRWTGAESGETTYAIQRDGTLLVIDRVGAPGNLREFGRSTLRRVLAP